MAKKKRVLFLCIGNICRSPMAEAMARTYGSDVLEVQSAGLQPAMNTSTYTRNVLTEKNIHLGDHLPRRFRDLNLTDFDLIVNLSGSKLPGSLATPVENWNVDDPFGGTEDDFRAARERIEMLVMNLILRVRTGKI
ncbi:MAG TPA: low molecular weight phosphatase family protein [Bryobacteraceae bacterium]|nr:low molecular weight phosphatase family protein [Bryobacteraceae bacterium]